ncbi:MAG TPA: phosphoribosyltransferase family protein, partial [Bacteroidota bacterium]|nr:phosphoribosyltransferase family protein [Bacteroidota bacterium]
KGAMVFAADLIREIQLPVRIETIIAKSYGMNIETSGKVNIIKNDLNINGEDVIVVEDIIDTGITMAKLLKNLERDKPRSISVCSLLFKPDKIIEKIDIKYLGFSIDPLFVIGYGIDYAEQGRNLKDIYIKVK